MIYFYIHSAFRLTHYIVIIIALLENVTCYKKMNIYNIYKWANFVYAACLGIKSKVVTAKLILKIDYGMKGNLVKFFFCQYTAIKIYSFPTVASWSKKIMKGLVPLNPYSIRQFA